MKHAIACFLAGRSGQSMPARVDKSTGQVIAVCSAIGGVVSIGSFFIGRFSKRMPAEEK